MRIFDYAKVADWDSRLQVLADLAERERWAFRCVPDALPLPVLDSYIRYTFLRVHEQAKIAEGDRLSCFNTGLLTANQEEIFGVFRISDLFDPHQPVGPANKKWFLTSWARAVVSRLMWKFEGRPSGILIDGHRSTGVTATCGGRF